MSKSTDNLNQVFYYNSDDSCILYSNLLSELNRGCVYHSKVFSKTSSFFLNLLKAIIHNVDITLLDPLQPVHESNSYTEVKATTFVSFEEFKSLIKNSTAQVSIFTSGTTGQPKKVTHTVQNLIREVRENNKHLNDIWAYAYNPTHMAGLQVLFQALLNQNTIIDVFSKGNREIVELIKNKKITHISATPTFYRFLLPLYQPIDSLKSVSLGGEKSNDSLIIAISKSFPKAKIFNIYASTEAGTIFSSHGSNFKIQNNKLDLVKIIDNELLLHYSLLGTSEGLNEEWYATGDIVEWIDQHEKIFKFISRKNEMINVGGNKVNTNKVEEILLEMKQIKACFVYGKPNPLLGNMIFADLVLYDSSSITEIEIRKSLREILEPFEIPRKIGFVKSLETTRTGKLKRKK